MNEHSGHKTTMSVMLETQVDGNGKAFSDLSIDANGV